MHFIQLKNNKTRDIVSYSKDILIFTRYMIEIFNFNLVVQQDFVDLEG